MTIGLPIEIKVREYLSKIFLGIKLVEKLNQDVLNQALRYNINLKAKYILISNGLDLKCCEINFQKGELIYLQKLPLIE